MGRKAGGRNAEVDAVNLLVADDNASALESLELLLGQFWGYQVVTAPDGAAAWDILQRPAAPRLLLLNWQMPRLDGVEVTRRLRQTARGRDAYVLITSAGREDGEVVQALAGGADDFLMIPLCLNELRSRLHAGERFLQRQGAVRSEADWETADDPDRMLAWLRGRAGEGRLRRFACACVRRLWSQPCLGEASRAVVATSERYAEGSGGEVELRGATALLGAVPVEYTAGDWTDLAAQASARLVCGWGEAGRRVMAAAALIAAWAAREVTALERREGPRAGEEEARCQSALLRCLFGNPWRPLPPRTFPTHVTGLAQSIYAGFPVVSEEHAILADALEELGEANAAAHCRTELHAKGCHVLDWITGRSWGLAGA
jgi:CheY-like chemotaxis protein